MDPDEIAKENEQKVNQSTSLTPEQGGTQLSGTAAPAPVTPTTSTATQTVPTKTGNTAQATVGNFQQANQAKIAALGNITNQRLQERVGAANQAIAGQKAARVDDVNAQTYAGPKTSTLEDIGGNEALQTTLAGAGRKADITKASQQVAGFGAYNELKNLATNAGSKTFTNNLGVGGRATDNLLSRSNAATQQGLREQTRGVQNTLKAEQTGALDTVKAAGEGVNKANTASEASIGDSLRKDYDTQKALAIAQYDDKARQAGQINSREYTQNWLNDYKKSLGAQANNDDDFRNDVTAGSIDQAAQDAMRARGFDKGSLGATYDPGDVELARRLGYTTGNADQSESTKLRELSANKQLGISALNRILKGGIVTPELGAPQAASSLDTLRAQIGRGQPTNATASAGVADRLKAEALQRWNASMAAQNKQPKEPITLNNTLAL